MKRLCIFCDGTWQTFDQPRPTNVALLARCVLPGQISPTSPAVQVVYYDDGVGVGGGVANGLVHWLGGTLGDGLDAKIRDAYRFLCLNYTPGDQILIFGFSRGAYTARSLGGLLSQRWILKRSQLDRIDEVMTTYRTRAGEEELAKLRDEFSWPVPSDASSRISYLGVWDTVGSLGIPDVTALADIVDSKYKFHDLSLSPFVASARHAVSTDEERATFRPTLWDNIDAMNASTGKGDEGDALYAQQWFPGVHGSVGGGGVDGGISIAPLTWIAEGAQRAGLQLDNDLWEPIISGRNDLANFPAKDWTLGAIALDAFGLAPREPGPQELEQISQSARHRWEKRIDYRPVPLRFVLGTSG